MHSFLFTFLLFYPFFLLRAKDMWNGFLFSGKFGYCIIFLSDLDFYVLVLFSFLLSYAAFGQGGKGAFRSEHLGEAGLWFLCLCVFSRTSQDMGERWYH